MCGNLRGRTEKRQLARGLIETPEHAARLHRHRHQPLIGEYTWEFPENMLR